MTDQALVEQAFTMLDKSYVPNSHFPVGAALEGAYWVIYTGCNVENAAYGSTLCAERTALVKASSEGCRSFTRLAVVGNSADYCWPCGACRQVILETEKRYGQPIRILLYGKECIYEIKSIGDLLPLSFDASAMED